MTETEGGAVSELRVRFLPAAPGCSREGCAEEVSAFLFPGLWLGGETGFS